MHDTNLPLPNIYYATVQSGITGEVHHLYVAADFTGAALTKTCNLCAEQFHFRPYRSNSVVKLRRMRLQDYIECPEALGAAIRNAQQLGEEATVARLAHRPRQVQQAIMGLAEGARPVNTEAAAHALGEALRQAAAL